MKTMAPVLLVLMGTSIAAFGADALIGKWKQNSQLSGGGLHLESTPPAMLEIEAAGENEARIKTEQNPFLTYPLDGSQVMRTEGRNAGQSQGIKRLHPSVWEFHRKGNGQNKRGKNPAYDEDGYLSVSWDGKILIWAVLRTYTDGKTLYYNRVFDRQ